jgi:hypothetical protein
MFRQRFFEEDFSKKSIFFGSRSVFHCGKETILFSVITRKGLGLFSVIARSSCLYSVIARNDFLFSVIARSDSDVAISSP